MPRLRERLVQQRNQFDSFPASTGQDNWRRVVNIVDIDHKPLGFGRHVGQADKFRGGEDAGG